MSRTARNPSEVVELRNDERGWRVDTRGLKRYAQRLLEAMEMGDRTLSLLLTDDRRMSRLHVRWMGDPTPTDVLSFPTVAVSPASGRPAFRSGPSPRRANAREPYPPLVLGDVAISVETAARRKPKDVKGEIRRYLLHGILHLAGYDHVRPEARRRMQRQARRLPSQ